MPIKFRCMYCGQLLGIARRKAGTVVSCPKCDRSVGVPVESDQEKSKAVSAPVFEAEGFGDWIEGSPSGSVSHAPRGGTGAADLPRQADHGRPPSPMGRLATTGRPAGAVAEPSYPPPASGANAGEPLIWLDSETGRVVAITVILMVAAFGIGVAVGRFSLAESKPQSPAPGPPPGPVAAAGTQPAEATKPTTDAAVVSGVIQYKPEGGGAPVVDAGAAIIAVPDPKSWQGERLSARGLRPGDRLLTDQASQQRLIQIGGNNTFADSKGSYTLNLSKPGSYMIVLISAHRVRQNPEDLSDIAEFQKMFSDYRELITDREYLLLRRQVTDGQSLDINWTFESLGL